MSYLLLHGDFPICLQGVGIPYAAQQYILGSNTLTIVLQPHNY